MNSGSCSQIPSSRKWLTSKRVVRINVLLILALNIFTSSNMFFLINSEAYGVFEGNLIETLCKPLEGLSKNIICSDFPKLFLTFSFIGGMPKITEKDVKMLRFLVPIEATSLF